MKKPALSWRYHFYVRLRGKKGFLKPLSKSVFVDLIWSEIVLPSWVWDDAARSSEATHINMSRHANIVSFFSRLFSSLKTLNCPLCEKGESVIKNPENGRRGEWRTSGSLFWCYGFSLRKRERRDWSIRRAADQSQARPCTFQHSVRLCGEQLHTFCHQNHNTPKQDTIILI